MAVNITIKPAKPLNIDLDLDQLSFGDALQLMQLQSANTQEELQSVMSILSKLIGQDATTLPLRHVQAIMEATMDAIKMGSDAEKN